MEESITLIAPTYNERENLGTLVKRVHQSLAGYNYRLFIVDDDSRDGTGELARSLAKEYPVDVLVRKGKRGLASAVVDGIASSKGEIIGVIDADLQHPPELIPQMVAAIKKGADIAVGSRYVQGGGCEGWGLMRRVMSRGAIAIAHVLLPQTRGIKDPVAGFFLFRRQVIDKANLQPFGYKILLEVIVQGRWCKLTEVPYHFKVREMGKSKLKARQQIDYMKHILSLMRRSGELLRFIKFISVGFSGIFVNEGLLWTLVEGAGMKPSMASPIAIEASILSNFTLNNFFTFADRRSGKLSNTLVSLIKYNAVSIIGLAINWAILWLLNTVAGIHYLVANLFGIVAAALFNYLLSNRWAWDTKKRELGEGS